MAYKEIVQYRAIMEADIQKNSGETLRGATIHALFPLSIFTGPLQLLRELFREAKSRRGELPRTLYAPTGQFEHILPVEAKRLGLPIVRVPEIQLLPFIGEARDGYKEYLSR